MSEADTLTPSKAFTQIHELYGQTLGDRSLEALPDIMGAWIRLTPPERHFHLAKLRYAQVELLEGLRKEIHTNRAILTVLGGDLLERANIGLELLAQLGEEEGGSDVEETRQTHPGETRQAEPGGHHQAGDQPREAAQAADSDHRDAGEPASKVSGGKEIPQILENVGEGDGSATDSAEPLEEGEKEEELSLAEVMAGMDDDDPNEVGEDDDLVGLEEDDQAEEDDHQEEEEDDRAEPEKNSATVRQEDQDKSAGSFQEDGQPQPATTGRQDLAAGIHPPTRRQPSFPGAAA